MALVKSTLPIHTRFSFKSWMNRAKKTKSEALSSSRGEARVPMRRKAGAGREAFGGGDREPPSDALVWKVNWHFERIRRAESELCTESAKAKTFVKVSKVSLAWLARKLAQLNRVYVASVDAQNAQTAIQATASVHVYVRNAPRPQPNKSTNAREFCNWHSSNRRFQYIPAFHLKVG